MRDETIRTRLRGGAERMKRLMRLIVLRGVDPSPLTTHRFKFAEPGKAFKMIQAKAGGIIKTLVTFAQTAGITDRDGGRG